MTDLDGELVNQLGLHRGMHTIVKPLLAHYRSYLLKEKLDAEVRKEPLSLDVVQALEGLNRWHELAESVTPEKPQW